MQKTPEIEGIVMDQKSESRSYSRNLHFRKISIGILADAGSNAEAISRSIEMLAKESAGLQKQSLHQGSGRCLQTNIEANSPVFRVPSQPSPTENGLIHHCAPVAEANVLEVDATLGKKTGTTADSGNGSKCKKSKLVENPACLVQPILLEKNVEDKSREIRTAGHETLRTKLLEVLGNVSSPIKSAELNIGHAKVGIQSPVAMVNLNSDTIESDSEKKSPGRPIKRYTRRRKSVKKREHQELELEKSTRTKKDLLQKRAFSFKGDQYGRLCGNSKDITFASKTNKAARESSRMEIHEGSKYDTARGKNHSESRRRSSVPVQKFVEVSNANSSMIREKDKFSDLVISTHEVMAKPQKDIGQPQDVGISKDQLVDHEDRERYSFRKAIYYVKNNNEAPVSNNRVGFKDRLTDPVVVQKYSSFDSKTMAEIQMGNEQSPDLGIFKDQLVDNEDNANSLFGKTISKMNDSVLVASNSTKRNDPTNVIGQPMDVEHTNLMNQQRSISNCSAKKRRTHADDPPSPQSWINLIGPSIQSKGNLMENTPAEKLFNFSNIRNFKSICSSKSIERRQRELDALSDGADEKFCFSVEPTFNMDVGGKNNVQGSSTDGMDSESLGYDSPMSVHSEKIKGCREPLQSSPEIHHDENFKNDSERAPANEKDGNVTESQEGTPPVSLDQNLNEDLGSVVTLLIMALDRVKTKLSSLTRKRTVAILQSSSEDIHSIMQNADTQIKADMSKLTNLCHLKRELLETKFQEKQEHLIGVFKRFKEEVNQHLQDYEGLIDDMEEHKADLKRTVERQGAAHKRIVSQVGQEIGCRIQDAESKILAVQKWNQEKMLQLKTVVSESIKHVAF